MTEKLKKIIQEEIVKLPKELVDVISAFDWVSATEEIGKKYLLNENQITDFQTETMLVLFGIEEPNLYEINIEDEVGTTKADAKKIAEEVVTKIFVPISNALAENIKKSDKVKNGNTEQNINFILSGGDYSAFMEPREEVVGREEPVVPVFSLKEENFKR
jgi:hypothetical protein